MDSNFAHNSTSITPVTETVTPSRLDTPASGSQDPHPSEFHSSIANRPQISTSSVPPLSAVSPMKEDSAVVEEGGVLVAAQAREDHINTLVSDDKSPITDSSTAALTAVAYERSNLSLVSSKAGSLTPGTTPGTSTPASTTTKEPPIETESRAERHTIRLASSFLSFFSCGWADGTPGTIIPYLEVTYGLSHFKVSLLFIAAAIGTQRVFIPPPIQGITRKYSKRLDDASTSSGHSVALGRFWTVMFGCLCQVLYYVIAISNPPFGALCLAFGLGGVAVSLFFGQMNAYVASASLTRRQGQELGYLHGSYGVGAFASPLVCQTLLAAGWKWHRFYWTSFGFSLLNALLMIIAFHPTKKEWETDREAGLSVQESEKLALPQATGGQQADDIEMQAHKANTANKGFKSKPKSTMQLALRMPYVWLFMVFLGLYTGAETTTGGWIVTYLLKQRNANPDTVGYVASGFWGGVASGRIILGHVSPYIGIQRERHLVHLYIVIALVMTFIIWFVPSFIGNASCAAFTGLFLGPIFPTALSLATKILPKEVHLTALAAMGSFSSIGTAVFPFAAGGAFPPDNLVNDYDTKTFVTALASAKGVTSIPPFMGDKPAV
ncbi:hypothetical protein FS837_008946 [Tulasnella sp. UAMH 9824]|nr:hypothetical protein FS837_008946 [Tulasnella sp. UAMH 9824]